jgi:hypothetical protein
MKQFRSIVGSLLLLAFSRMVFMGSGWSLAPTPIGAGNDERTCTDRQVIAARQEAFRWL